MTRLMYDGIDPSQVPAGAQLVAGYVDGRWPDAAALGERYPGAVLVRIAVFASTDDGTVLDVETGDATPEQAVNWVLLRRRDGVDPSVYCNLNTWPAVRAAFQTHDVVEPHYWIASYDGNPAIPAGAVAHQYANHPGYDASSVADYWPGVDPLPKPPAPPAPPAARDPRVVVLQEEINRAGHSPALTVDGVKGPLTKAGFSWAMGRVGTLTQGATGEPVRVLQAMLNTWGGDPQIAVDGTFGPRTFADVEGFQRTHPACGGVDGIVGPRTKRALAQ